MTVVTFPEVNHVFGPPKEFVESQVRQISAYVGRSVGGSCDGAPITVVAWRPSVNELEAIQQGQPIFMTVIGGLPPHALSTNFHAATHLA